MALAAVNYPTLSAQDADWIQSIRRQHDELYFEVVDQVNAKPFAIRA